MTPEERTNRIFYTATNAAVIAFGLFMVGTFVLKALVPAFWYVLRAVEAALD